MKFTKYKEEINKIEEAHSSAPHERHLQKALAKELTILVHSHSDFEGAVKASDVLFKGTIDDLTNLKEDVFLDIFEGVPSFSISASELANGIGLIDLLAEKTTIFPSKSEARKLLQAGGVSTNKHKIEDALMVVNLSHTINKKYILIQKGKKNYFLCKLN